MMTTMPMPARAAVSRQSSAKPTPFRKQAADDDEVVAQGKKVCHRLDDGRHALDGEHEPGQDHHGHHEEEHGDHHGLLL